jgi:hypothetical protein
MTTRESIGGEEATKKEKGAIIRTKPFIAWYNDEREREGEKRKGKRLHHATAGFSR